MEKNLYRLVNSFLPVMILLLGFGNELGIAGLKAYHFILALMVTIGLVGRERSIVCEVLYRAAYGNGHRSYGMGCLA